ATYTNDFVELYNSGSTPVSLDGWSVQATSATATSWTANGAITLLSGTIQPGHYYLVQESQGNGGTTPLPAPDATGVITMSGTQAKVALVSGSASPNSLEPAGNTLLTVQVAPATLPPSTNVSVAANLTSIGGSATQQLYDDGTNGDQSAGDNVFSFLANVDRLATTGPKSMI